MLPVARAMGAGARPSLGHAVQRRAAPTPFPRTGAALAARSAAFRVRVEASNKPTVKVDFGDAKGVDLFFKKIAAAWSIFFPEKPKSTPKDDVKKRLRMILVADRCGLSPGSMEMMKESVLRALQSFVDVESLDNVDINVTSDPEMGTIYSVNIPVKRVRPQARASLKNMENAEEVADGIKFSWTDMDMDPDNKDSVQARFPYGA